MARYTLRIYLVFLVIAVGISAAIFLSTLHQADLKKQDEKMQQVSVKISDKLYEYTSDKQSVPASLAEADIRNVPPAITYKKLSSTRYRICTDFQTPYAAYSYKKGRYCEDSTAYLKSFVSNSDGGYTVCGIKTNHFNTEGLMIPPTMSGADIVNISGQLFTFSPDSKAFDENCSELKQSDLHIGDKIDAFSITYPLDAAGNVTRSSTSIFLKRTQ